MAPSLAGAWIGLFPLDLFDSSSDPTFNMQLPLNQDVSANVYQILVTGNVYSTIILCWSEKPKVFQGEKEKLNSCLVIGNVYLTIS